MRWTLPLITIAAVAVPALASESIPVPTFREVQIRGGGMVDIVPGPMQRVTLVEGSTQFTRFHVDSNGQLKIDTCADRCPQIYRMRVEVQSPSVPDVAVNGGGIITVGRGFSPQRHLEAAISGGGKIDTSDVDAATVGAAINGGGDILIRARDALSAAVNGGGLIRFRGHPQVSSAVRGGGLVREAD